MVPSFETFYISPDKGDTINARVLVLPDLPSQHGVVLVDDITETVSSLCLDNGRMCVMRMDYDNYLGWWLNRYKTGRL